MKYGLIGKYFKHHGKRKFRAKKYQGNPVPQNACKNNKRKTANTPGPQTKKTWYRISYANGQD